MPVAIEVAGRTDKGVHALGQVVSAPLPEATELAELVDRLNSMLDHAIVVRSAEWADDDFHARFSARWRRYRYVVRNAPQPDPFTRDRSWWVRDPLDLDAMNDAAAALVGSHDFSSFCRRPKPVAGAPEASLCAQRVGGVVVGRAAATKPRRWPSRSRPTPSAIRWFGRWWDLLVGVGRGRVDPADIASLIAARDRAALPNPAPPQGLFLETVGYEEWDPRELGLPVADGPE